VAARLKALPLDGGGLGGGDASADTSQDMKKQPPDGAAARVRNLRQNMTEAETRVWRVLRAHRIDGRKFRRQVPIGRYIADFVCHEARLVVEIDGGQHDLSSPRESERSGFLQSQGYRILRFWNNEVLANPEGVYEMIVNELAASPPPRPSPVKGRVSVTELAASPPPRPSPIKGEGSRVNPERVRRASIGEGQESG
jgi:very-short-patch-repair endonuclease